jgi:hypothetical protein
MKHPLPHLGAAGILLACVATACVTPAPLPTAASTPAPPPPIQEEAITPAGTVRLDIIDFAGTPSADHKTVVVGGTLVNNGTRATREISVRVDALDRGGAAIMSADAKPSTQVIAPGATATFSVRFEKRPGIDSYHAEAIAR